MPLKIRILNDQVLQKAKAYRPLPLELEVHNQSENVLECELSVEETDDFFIGGELKSFVSFMPQEKYLFRYNLIPHQIGRLSLPKFNITELLEADKQISIIKGFTSKCLIVK